MCTIPLLIIAISLVVLCLAYKQLYTTQKTEGFGLTRVDTYQSPEYNPLLPYPQYVPYPPITTLPADMGGLGTPIEDINQAPQLTAIQNAFATNTYDSDSIGNLKLGTQHTNWIHNMM
jgi:hypothetical protein